MAKDECGIDDRGIVVEGGMSMLCYMRVSTEVLVCVLVLLVVVVVVLVWM